MLVALLLLFSEEIVIFETGSGIMNIAKLRIYQSRLLRVTATASMAEPDQRRRPDEASLRRTETQALKIHEI